MSLLTLDFGSDGDDTYHTPYPHYDIPFWVQSTLVPENINDNDVVDLIFTNFSSWGIITILNSFAPSGHSYDMDEIEFYLEDTITLTNMFERYSKIHPGWGIPANGTCD